ncbi:MAG: ThuA domain-containing protein, partial [Planctomycetota bacterium]|nr:ThuA domain-containing protein [Planctomycetota bacterium]
MKRMLGLLLVIGWVGSLVPLGETASAADAKASKILMVTQSAGFRHGSVNRRQNSLAPAEIAMTQLG